MAPAGPPSEDEDDDTDAEDYRQFLAESQGYDEDAPHDPTASGSGGGRKPAGGWFRRRVDAS